MLHSISLKSSARFFVHLFSELHILMRLLVVTATRFRFVSHSAVAAFARSSSVSVRCLFILFTTKIAFFCLPFSSPAYSVCRLDARASRRCCSGGSAKSNRYLCMIFAYKQRDILWLFHVRCRAVSDNESGGGCVQLWFIMPRAFSLHPPVADASARRR